MKHAFIIGRPKNEPSNADTARVFAKLTSPAVSVARCGAPGELEGAVKAIAAGGLIDLLDIFDHANKGVQALGDEALFQSNDISSSPLIGGSIARSLCPYLSRTARVRLLGCSSAEGRPGRLLLFKLTRIIGQQRMVFGTIGAVDQNDFDENGFIIAREPSYLFDNLAAIDGEAPPRNDRITNHNALLP